MSPMAAAKSIFNDHHRLDRAHTVCMLTVIQFLVIYGASAFALSATITALIFIRDAGLALFAAEIIEEFEEVR